MCTQSEMWVLSVVSFCSTVGSDGPAHQIVYLRCENKKKTISCTVVHASVQSRDIRKLRTKGYSGHGQSTVRGTHM
jgi:hypothetical protein